ncbi:hypothetical protein ACTFIZ_012769 [Dictyostelium cf. discoideum]
MTGISKDIALSISKIIKNSKSESTIVSKKAKTDVASKLIQGEDASTELSLPLPSAPGVPNDPISNDPVSNDPVSTDQMCEPVGNSDAPHNNKFPTKIKGGITNSNKNVAITITGGSCNFYL